MYFKISITYILPPPPPPNPSGIYNVMSDKDEQVNLQSKIGCYITIPTVTLNI